MIRLNIWTSVKVKVDGLGRTGRSSARGQQVSQRVGKPLQFHATRRPVPCYFRRRGHLAVELFSEVGPLRGDRTPTPATTPPPRRTPFHRKRGVCVSPSSPSRTFLSTASGGTRCLSFAVLTDRGRSVISPETWCVPCRPFGEPSRRWFGSSDAPFHRKRGVCLVVNQEGTSDRVTSGSSRTTRWPPLLTREEGQVSPETWCVPRRPCHSHNGRHQGNQATVSVDIATGGASYLDGFGGTATASASAVSPGESDE